MKQNVGATRSFDQESLGRRINEIAKRVGGVRLLAEQAGLQSNQVYRYIQCKNMPAVDAVAALAEAAGVSVGWLISGEGDTDRASMHAPEGYVPVQMYPTAERVEMARMGTEVDRVALAKPYLEFILGLQPDKVFNEFVHDDAMEPTLLSGDLILVDARTPVPESLCGALYLLRKNNYLMVRRVVRRSDTKIDLLCDNVKHTKVTVSKEEWDVIGPVVAVWRRLRVDTHLKTGCDAKTETSTDEEPIFGL